MNKSRYLLVATIVISAAVWLYSEIFERDAYIAVAAMILVAGILYCKLDEIHKLLKDRDSDSQEENEE